MWWAALGAAAVVIGVALGFSIWYKWPGTPVFSGEPDIILVTIDTLRADALSFAGNQDVETPFLDRIARQAVVFSNAHAHNVITLPSHVNILTGLLPYQHGVRENAGFVLDPKVQTLAPMLSQRGYATGAFVGAFPLDARFGLTPGFDVYDDKYPEGIGKLDFKMAERPADEVLALAVDWWARQSTPRFMWIHLYDPHAPYAPPGEFATRYQSNAYLGEVAWVDSALEKFLGRILNPDTMLILTSDHGEALGDHGELTHGLFAYEATLKVPLIVYDPAAAKPRVETRPARHIDIVPTILDRLGLAQPPDRPGKSLLQFDEQARPTYFESLSASINRGWAPLVGLIDQGHKYIDLPLPELYDLTADPAESQNLVDQRRRMANHLRESLAAAAPQQPTAARAVTAEQSAQLLSLGYVTGTASKKTYTTADDPKNLAHIDTLMHRMVEHYQLGQPQRAVEIARELVKRQPDMPVAREMLAFLLQQTERTDAGIAILREAVTLGSASESMKIRLGLMLSEAGRAREAVEILESFEGKNNVEVLNAYGIALADVGRSGESVKQFQRVLTIDPGNGTAYQNLGIVALRSEQVQLAHEYLAKALQLDPQLPLALNTLGVIYARSGRDAEAMEAWSKAVALDPRLYDALLNLAVVAVRNQRWQLAESALSRFIQNAPPKRYARDLATARAMLREVKLRKG